ncbi:MAG: FAD-dependent oxidoreductase [Proteobacteria bacterium]|nr:FAD-dependent oxidoreductase [Pseudomonadota bacterium]
MKNIVVAGAGFAGMWAALAGARQAALSGVEVSIQLISPTAHLTIRPRLYQSNPQALAVPLHRTLQPVGVEHVAATVRSIDAVNKCLNATDDQGVIRDLPYDSLVLAMGSQVEMPEIAGLKTHGFAIDDFQTAVHFDQHLATKAIISGLDTIVIIGGGFCGIEIALEMRGRLSEHLGVDRARNARVVLVDNQSIGGPLGEQALPVIRAALESANIECREHACIVEVRKDQVVFDDGTEIKTDTVLNTAGLRAHPITSTLNLPQDSSGRLKVDDHLRAADHLFAAGDVAAAFADDDHLALMSCQHAMPMGKCAGANAVLDLVAEPLLVYRQPDYVTCLDLGEAGALLTRGWDRQLVMAGQEAKGLKNQINNQWIYPPMDDASLILEAAAMDWHPSRGQLKN